MEHILSKIPYREVPHEKVTLPERVFNRIANAAHRRDELYVPKVY